MKIKYLYYLMLPIIKYIVVSCGLSISIISIPLFYMVSEMSIDICNRSYMFTLMTIPIVSTLVCGTLLLLI
jgi:hypothetical protein